MNQIVQAQAHDLPEGSLRNDLQWMPPGEHTITCKVGGQTKTITLQVDEQTARTMDGALQRMRAAAARGEGDLPYLDLNHDDAEAAAHVEKLYWAGPDPKTGGVRAKVQWTAAGEAALLGRVYRRFSPSFLVDEQGRIQGAGNENFGGLVNRAAFRNIQPVLAKAGEDPFYARVAAVMEETGITEDAARSLVLKNEPDLWIDHLYMELGMDREKANRLGIKLAIEESGKTVTAKTCEAMTKLFISLAQERGFSREHELVAKARREAELKGIDFADAVQIVNAREPGLYASYMASLAKPASQPVAARPPSTPISEHAFVLKARDLGERKGIDFAEACHQLATNEPGLYQSYVTAIAPRRN